MTKTTFAYINKHNLKYSILECSWSCPYYVTLQSYKADSIGQELVNRTVNSPLCINKLCYCCWLVSLMLSGDWGCFLLVCLTSIITYWYLLRYFPVAKHVDQRLDNEVARDVPLQYGRGKNLHAAVRTANQHLCHNGIWATRTYRMLAHLSQTSASYKCTKTYTK